MSDAPPPSLKDLQRQLRFDITHLDFLNGVSPASAAWVKAGPPRTRESQLEIHAEAWFLRIHGAIAKDYGSVQRFLGAEAFERLVRHYLARHPSRTSSLAHVGDELVEFLEHWTDQANTVAALALARLEQGWLQCFHAAEAPARVLHLPCAVHAYWLEEAQAPTDAPEEHVLLWRHGGTVISRVLVDRR